MKASSASQKLSICLELQIEQLPQGTSAPGNCEIICKGEGAESFSTAFDENLVTKVALYVLRSHGIRGSVTFSDGNLRSYFMNATLTSNVYQASRLPSGYTCTLVYLRAEV